MRKFFKILVCAVLVLSFTSCRKAVERNVEKVKFLGIEDVRMTGLPGMEISAGIENGTRHKLVLDAAAIELYYDGAALASAELMERVEVEGNTIASVKLPWRLQIGNPLAALVALGRVREGDISAVTVNFSAEGRGGPAPVNISHKNMPLSEFLNIFGITTEDVNDLLKL